MLMDNNLFSLFLTHLFHVFPVDLMVFHFGEKQCVVNHVCYTVCTYKHYIFHSSVWFMGLYICYECKFSFCTSHIVHSVDTGDRMQTAIFLSLPPWSIGTALSTGNG